MNSTSKKSASNDMLKRLAQPNAWLLALVAVVVPNLIFLLATPYFLVYRLVSPPLYFLAAMISFGCGHRLFMSFSGSWRLST